MLQDLQFKSSFETHHSSQLTTLLVLPLSTTTSTEQSLLTQAPPEAPPLPQVLSTVLLYAHHDSLPFRFVAGCLYPGKTVIHLGKDWMFRD